MMNGIRDLSFGQKSISKAKVGPHTVDGPDDRFIIVSLADRPKEGL